MVRSAQTAAILVVAALAPLAHGAASATITAVHATESPNGTDYDENSRPFEELLSELPYGSFKTIAEKTADLSENVKVRVNDRYSLIVSKAQQDQDGHVKTTVRVLGMPKNSSEEVEVLQMEVRLAKDKPVMIRGLRMDQGEIVVFLNLD